MDILIRNRNHKWLMNQEDNMNIKIKIKISIDLVMSVCLLLLVSYSLIGEELHEWIGSGMFLLVIFHQILNLNFYKNLFHGKYTFYRIIQVFLVVLILSFMMASMTSGIILSRYLYTWIDFHKGAGVARSVHMVAGYGGFILMPVHLGFHWSTILSVVKTKIRKESDRNSRIPQIMAVMAAGYGVYALLRRDILSYLVLKNQYVFFDYSEPLWSFFADYIAIMCLWIWVGFYLAKTSKYLTKRRREAH